MDSTTQINITHSKYYSPALNAAIFDGPVKIYFSQAQEAAALRLYFEMNKKIESLSKVDNNSAQIYVMIYPTSENFYNSFDKSVAIEQEGLVLMAHDYWEENHVIGVRGPIESENLEDIYLKVQNILGLPELDFV
jgi:hypothetical protein